MDSVHTFLFHMLSPVLSLSQTLEISPPKDSSSPLSMMNVNAFHFVSTLDLKFWKLPSCGLMNEGTENLPAVLSQFHQHFSKGICVTKLILLHTTTIGKTPIGVAGWDCILSVHCLKPNVMILFITD